MADGKESGKSIFRQKSIERIESPEKLNDYLRVTSPTVWIVLASIIVLLVGVCIWGVLGHIDSTVTSAVIVNDDETVCLVPESALEGVLKYRCVTVEGQDLEMAPSVLTPQTITEDTDVYVMMAGNLSYGDVVYPIDVLNPGGRGRVDDAADSDEGEKPVSDAESDDKAESNDETESSDETVSSDSAKSLPNGTYGGDVLVEEVTPFSLFFN